MASPLTFDYIREFIATAFPDPEPKEDCVRAHRAVAQLLYSAALLDTVDPVALHQFTGLQGAFIAVVAWNMRNSNLWGDKTYDGSAAWLNASGFDRAKFLDDVEIGWAQAWSLDAVFPHSTIEPYDVFCDLHL